ncbi:MAG: AtpZ/AtpI family protein [Candidatus Nomurabacteria bacterium]|nr:AtpZ/AtpI family protein [Candidatus Nomurabacteria bacterium]
MEDNTKKDSIFKSEYMGAFIRISTWIIFPVILSLFVGKYFDNKYGTTPWILGVLLCLSFTFSMAMIVRITKSYMQDTEKNDSNK